MSEGLWGGSNLFLCCVYQWNNSQFYPISFILHSYRNKYVVYNNVNFNNQNKEIRNTFSTSLITLKDNLYTFPLPYIYKLIAIIRIIWLKERCDGMETVALPVLSIFCYLRGWITHQTLSSSFHNFPSLHFTLLYCSFPNSFLGRIRIVSFD